MSRGIAGALKNADGLQRLRIGQARGNGDTPIRRHLCALSACKWFVLGYTSSPREIHKEDKLKNSVLKTLVFSVATFGLLVLSGPAWAGSIVSGAVTGGSALTADGTFIDLTVP